MTFISFNGYFINAQKLQIVNVVSICYHDTKLPKITRMYDEDVVSIITRTSIHGTSSKTALQRKRLTHASQGQVMLFTNGFSVDEYSYCDIMAPSTVFCTNK